ncbi:MAG: hypothetical protein ACR2PK_12025, partial [Acidimicrobiales bacterium]
VLGRICTPQETRCERVVWTTPDGINWQQTPGPNPSQLPLLLPVLGAVAIDDLLVFPAIDRAQGDNQGMAASTSDLNAWTSYGIDAGSSDSVPIAQVIEYNDLLVGIRSIDYFSTGITINPQ